MVQDTSSELRYKGSKHRVLLAPIAMYDKHVTVDQSQLACKTRRSIFSQNNNNNNKKKRKTYQDGSITSISPASWGYRSKKNALRHTP